MPCLHDPLPFGHVHARWLERGSEAHGILASVIHNKTHARHWQATELLPHRPAGKLLFCTSEVVPITCTLLLWEPASLNWVVVFVSQLQHQYTASNNSRCAARLKLVFPRLKSTLWKSQFMNTKAICSSILMKSMIQRCHWGKESSLNEYSGIPESFLANTAAEDAPTKQDVVLHLQTRFQAG